MHKDFSDWYRMAKIEPKEEWLSKRWEAVKEATEGIDSLESFEYIRMFYQLELEDKNFKEEFLDVLQGCDPTFPRRDNSNELSLLSGAIILNYIIATEPSELSDALALALVCMHCNGLFSEILFSDMITEIEQHLDERSVSSERLIPFPTIEDLNQNAWEKEIDALSDIEDPNQNAWEESISVLPEGSKPYNDIKKLFNMTSKHIDKIISGFASVKRTLENLSNVKETVDNISCQLYQQREETNILWWVFGEYSRDLMKPIKSFKLPAVCIISGKELADLVVGTPGPVAAEAFLSKMLSFAKSQGKVKLTINNAVNMVPREWREEFIEQSKISVVEDFCPVIFAIKKSLETDGDNDWLAAFKNASKIDPTIEFEPIRLAMQTYREAMLLSLVEKISE